MDLQMTGIGVLRGYNDTRIISVICFIAYWIIGLPWDTRWPAQTGFADSPHGRGRILDFLYFLLGFGGVMLLAG